LCAFPQHLKKDGIVNGWTVKKKFSEIISHGCQGCGSNPIHPGNNVNDGEITVNYVIKTCGEGVCGLAATNNKPREIEPVDTPSTEPETVDTPSPVTPNVASGMTSTPEDADTQLGVNCRGSGRCTSTCRRNIHQLKWYIDRLGKS
jgi:hypothetical protein